MSDRRSPLQYHAAWWIPGAHARTLYGRIVRRRLNTPATIESWTTPDDDFLEVHRLARPASAPSNTPHVLILHGLEGGAHSHYARGLLDEMHGRGWSADLVIWRSCGTEPNRARRFYHSGETEDLAFALDHVARELPDAPLLLTGISLGGNVLLKYLGEQGGNVSHRIAGAAAVSVPFDLARGAAYIDRGFSKVYQRYFLDSLKKKALEKQSRYPDICDPADVSRLRTLTDFDNLLTSRLHGFRDAMDYYTKSSSIGFLSAIRVDTLLLNAVDDPFLPPDVLDQVGAIAADNPHLTVDFPARGGHAGFVGGWNPFRPVYYLERRVGEFLALCASAHTQPR